MTTYDVNQFKQVVPYNNGRRSTNTREYRELTEYEEQLLGEIEELNQEIAELNERIESME